MWDVKCNHCDSARRLCFRNLLELSENLRIVLRQIADHASIIEQLFQVADHEHQVEHVSSMRVFNKTEVSAE